MTIGLLLTAFGLGLRHGVDWDHIAAIADLNSATDDRRRGFWLSVLYALGHAIVVFTLGTLLIVAGGTIPESLDVWMGRVVGVTLVFLGLTVLWDLRRNRGAIRLRSRWMLIIDGTFAGLRRVRQFRDRRRIVIEHEHDHEHGDELAHDGAAAHDHSHLAVGAEVAEPVPAVARLRLRERGRRHSHAHSHQLDLPVDRPTAGSGMATGIGMLHGVGIESPTQIAIFVASTSVVGTAGGLTLLGAWVLGLVISNAGLALAVGAGLLQPDTTSKTFLAIALTVATLSIALGLRYLFLV